MALDDDIGILTGVELFEVLSQEQLRLLAFGTERLRLPPGRELYREGAPADCAFVVIQGQVTLFTEQDGQRIALASHGKGSVLGELALIAETTRLTGAMAETEVELMRLNRTLFRRILEEYPDVAAALHRRLAQRFAEMTESIGNLAPKFSQD
ncbi:cyclic nucleotide-binding domain-containing protein [Mesorhizobium xinjiangense]|uniref:cyclic nucleotide-binding domain-containing protein n=1 Tax=Mesorhizobium xinjiangense TaxID=2678685 RepID=UPI0012ED0CF3|nr:cyclic nucleotide-binding domain-containing protein [Mesorhizobium xinjiangense]